MIQGLAYPLVSDGKGGLKLSTEDEAIRDHIISWLETEKFERLGLPNYGTRNFVFNTFNNFGAVGVEIQRELIANIPQAEFRVRSELTPNGEGLITIEWSISEVQQSPIQLAITID